jgi:lipid-A-disaccharide synthase
MDKIYFIAGEHSGDFIGSKILSQIFALKNILSVKGIGGPLMKHAGQEQLFDYSAINMMGVWEILPHIFRLKKLIKQTIADIIAFAPDVLVTIDSPGFTFRVAKEIRKLAPQIKLVHIVAPSVWAYKPSRAEKYAKIYDLLLTLFDFEVKFFTAHNLHTICIGHPIFEQDFNICDPEIAHRDFGIIPGEKIISITPGSRLGEIKRHMPVICETLEILRRRYGKLRALFVQSDQRHVEQIESYLRDASYEYVFAIGQKRLEAFAVSDCAIAKSGTNSFEVAASGLPMVVGYKLHPISAFLLRCMIKIPYVCLINIIAGQEIIPELLQENFTPYKLSNALIDIMQKGKEHNPQVIEAQGVLNAIGLHAAGHEEEPSYKAAKAILALT